MSSGISEALFFLRSWISDPLRVAAVAPSGEALARLITSEIDGDTGPVMELGPGTGAFTRALLGRGVDERDLLLVEIDPRFGAMLSLKFPSARIVPVDAARLRHMEKLEEIRLGAVVSGLPLLSMSPRKVLLILKGAFDLLEADASFFQFTYGTRCPVPAQVLARLGLVAHRMGGTFRNLPPASVYRISRRAPSAYAFAAGIANPTFGRLAGGAE